MSTQLCCKIHLQKLAISDQAHFGQRSVYKDPETVNIRETSCLLKRPSRPEDVEILGS